METFDDKLTRHTNINERLLEGPGIIREYFGERLWPDAKIVPHSLLNGYWVLKGRFPWSRTLVVSVNVFSPNVLLVDGVEDADRWLKRNDPRNK